MTNTLPLLEDRINRYFNEHWNPAQPSVMGMLQTVLPIDLKISGVLHFATQFVKISS